jgi:phenylpyruvate tautomerase
MPWIHVKTSADSVKDQQTVLKELSAATAAIIGKPELYVMAGLEHNDMLMSGTKDACAMVEIKSIGGLSSSVVGKLAANISEILEKHLHIPKDRIYINFADIPAKSWAWNGETFG